MPAGSIHGIPRVPPERATDPPKCPAAEPITVLVSGFSAMSLKFKLILALVVLGLVDAVIPIPILGIILLVVIFQRPPWFLDLVRRVYG
jgi:hypothetical protein